MGGLLRGQTVVVLGGSSGIGFAVAELAAAEGARVFACSRSGKAPPTAERRKIDISDREGLGKVLQAARPIDHLVHSIGSRFGATPVASLDEALLPSAFEVKIFSAVHAVRLALPHLSDAASITFTSGQVSRKFGVGSLVKGALNSAVDAAGRHLAKELAPRRVNVVSPGLVDTSLWGEEGSESRKAMVDRAASALPVRRIGQPVDLAKAYLFLMTDSFVTGAVLDVDGGGLL